MKSIGSIIVRLIGALVLLGLAGFAYVMWQCNRPPFDLARLQQLQPGMSQAEVRHILGEPRSTNTTTWHYSRPLAWPIVHIRFDANGRFVGHEYDY